MGHVGPRPWVTWPPGHESRGPQAMGHVAPRPWVTWAPGPAMAGGEEADTPLRGGGVARGCPSFERGCFRTPASRLAGETQRIACSYHDVCVCVCVCLCVYVCSHTVTRTGEPARLQGPGTNPHRKSPSICLPTLLRPTSLRMYK
jgi:hypothetical protein